VFFDNIPFSSLANSSYFQLLATKEIQQYKGKRSKIATANRRAD
jgi:hypothetical protein